MFSNLIITRSHGSWVARIFLIVIYKSITDHFRDVIEVLLCHCPGVTIPKARFQLIRVTAKERSTVVRMLKMGYPPQMFP